MVAPGTYWSVENSSCSKVPGRDNYTFFHLLLLQPVLVFILITDSLSLYSFWCFSSSIILSPYHEILTFSSCFLRSFFFFFTPAFGVRWQREAPIMSDWLTAQSWDGLFGNWPPWASLRNCWEKKYLFIHSMRNGLLSQTHDGKLAHLAEKESGKKRCWKRRKSDCWIRKNL